ncbi:MAG TPA: TIGR02757 family protein [Bacteroidia bacterium]|jgi:uncharacterized protein (TIGR02757 family)|nr:TIGR02757 family protein [Bacteroidia bacterium]
MKHRLNETELKDFLESKVSFYDQPSFISNDPVSIPHLFRKKEDREIAGFLAATISWGQRPVILKNSLRIMELMEMDPHEFVLNAGKPEFKKLSSFVHRTFNGTDLTFFIASLKNIYSGHGGLEHAFGKNESVKDSILHFRQLFFSIKHPARVRKHVSDPSSNSSAKRLNMFLRWMVRKDDHGVDFGIWRNISPAQLRIPLDVHVGNTARKLGLLKRKQDDWKAVEELTERLRDFDADDPVKYDFALFGLGINEKF